MKRANRLTSGVKLLWIKFYHSWGAKLLLAGYVLAVVGGVSGALMESLGAQEVMVAEIGTAKEENEALAQLAKELESLKEQDPYAENESLRQRQEEIAKAYTEASQVFELRADLVAQGEESEEVERLIAKMLSEIGAEEYASAAAAAKEAESEIVKLFPTPEPVAIAVSKENNLSSTLPESGYGRVSVSTEQGTFTVAAVVAPGAKVVIETAGESDCSNNCPTKSLAEHVAASGGFAGINGAYFCPPDYPQCQDKINSFDTLAVNGRTGAVLNRDNNVYSVVPLMAAYGSSLTFYDQTVQWGVDTSGTGAIANYPRLVRDGQAASSDENGKGTRGFIGVKNGAVVIGHVFSASFADTARVLAQLGLSNAMNLDGGGSSALYFEGGYKVGPGRSLPTAVVLVR